MAGRLNLGDCIGEFVVSRYLAEGGIGEVYVARDRENGRDVALKVLSQFSAAAAARFEREVNVLAQLDHPGIVRLHAHGKKDGQPYLAMELLEGETLERVLERGPMDSVAAVGVIVQIASALAHAHARGVVHRDLKPANVFVCSTGVKVLDFGIARRLDDRKVTRTGAVIGTPAYMAPEQARGESTIDARADLFALGCVLYETLSGRQAFAAEHLVAVLAKVLLEEPQPLRDIVPGVAPALDALVTRLLAKDPAQRPTSATDVLAALEKIDPAAGAATPRSPRAVTAVTTGEQRMVSAIVVAQAEDLATDETSRATLVEDDVSALREIARQHRATIATLADGTCVVALASTGTVADQAARAAACALTIAATARDARIALATGHAETAGAWPVGAVIDRAAAILARGPRAGEIGVDDLTARLLEPRYDVQGGVLRGARNDGGAIRTLLGRPTPCVGREKELTLLDGTLCECIDEPAARVALLVAPPGIGKSRVLYEFVQRARARDVTVLAARTDPVSEGSALTIARQLVLAATQNEEDAHAQARIDRRVRSLGLADAARVSEFLGEIVGAPPPVTPTPQYVAARNDPRVRGEWYRRSFVEWLGGEVRRRPVLVTVEDLHWGDATSVAYLDDALRAHANMPLMVLATGRPEVAAVFPDVWRSSNAQTIRLGGLPKRAAERLVRDALGDACPSDEVVRLVARADGNAFYLEELVRSVAEHGSAELPETVLAMAQARLDALEPEARRILRAASVFGERFWHRGVEALLGGDRAGEWLETLARGEVIARSNDARFAGETEYAFRHGLLREVAYASLPRDDMATAHRHAGDWLESAGERDARVLAEHFERGGALDRAASALAIAAHEAYLGGDLAASKALASRGIAASANGKALGLLQYVRSGVALRTNDWNEALVASREAVETLDSGEPAWWDAGGVMMLASSTLGDLATAGDAVQRMLTAKEPSVFSSQYALAMTTLVLGFSRLGQFTMMAMPYDRFEATASRHREHEPAAAGWLELARTLMRMRDRPWDGLVSTGRALALFETVGDEMGIVSTGFAQGIVLQSLGRLDEAEQRLSASRDRSARANIRFITLGAKLQLELLALERGSDGDAAWLRDEAATSPDLVIRNTALAILGVRALRRGDLHEAERIAIDLLGAPAADTYARLTIASVALARGKPDDVLAVLDSPDALPWLTLQQRSEADLARCDALFALGEIDRARDAYGAARDRILETADHIADAPTRDAFLAAIASNATILARAQQLFTEPRGA